MRSHLIENHKRTLKLNDIQRSLLVGMLLGDGHLETQNQGRTYRLKVEHSIKQKEYFDWLYGQFKGFVRQQPEEKQKIVAGTIVTSYSFSTYSLGIFRFYAQQFYVHKKKIIPRMIGKLLDPQALAVWFMDDGSLKSNRHRTYIIHALGYSKRDLVLVQRTLKEKFGIAVGIHRQYDKYRLYIMSESADIFRSLVEPYVLPPMRYKLGEQHA